eukprot:366119-Chlamydomonas_euryale.AAC.23
MCNPRPQSPVHTCRKTNIQAYSDSVLEAKVAAAPTRDSPKDRSKMFKVARAALRCGRRAHLPAHMCPVAR